MTEARGRFLALEMELEIERAKNRRMVEALGPKPWMRTLMGEPKDCSPEEAIRHLREQLDLEDAYLQEDTRRPPLKRQRDGIPWERRQNPKHPELEGRTHTSFFAMVTGACVRSEPG